MPDEETRKQFLDWAKQRALEYVDRGDLVNAVSSMISDLGKNPLVYDAGSPGARFAMELGVFEVGRGSDAVRHWIEGFR